MSQTLLVELGLEELPPKNLSTLGAALVTNLTQACARLGLSHGSARGYASPRRLAVMLPELAPRQPDRAHERRGPALSAAFNSQGIATPAALGFARSCGCDVATLERMETPQGSWLVHRWQEPGATTLELLPGLLRKAYAELPIAKRMRWGDGQHEFVRPAHWLLALYGTEVVPLTLYGVSAERFTYGHRFHHPQPIELAAADDYPACLTTTGWVIADFTERQSRIRQQVATCAAALGGTPVYTPALLDEITALVEWPVILAGSFAPEYLALPAEVLIAVMQDHQRYFPLRDANGTLLAQFITVSNLQSLRPEVVQAGNERVLKPRLADAAFFWHKDTQQSLESRIDTLNTIVYQVKLGTLYAKAIRTAALSRSLAEMLQLDPALAERAAMLAKTDLTTDLVNEFPELQGTMGKYYARLDGEPEAVAIALEEQYQPRGGGAELPNSPYGQILALADKLDTLVGALGIGLKPTGDKDPYGLRRAAIGLLRISIEQRLNLDFEQLFSKAQLAYAGIFAPNAALTDNLLDFIRDRLRAYYQALGLHADVIACVLSTAPTRLYDAHLRLQAVAEFYHRPEAANLISAYKRIHNLIKQKDAIPTAFDLTRLIEPAEIALAQAYQRSQTEVTAALTRQDYASALDLLAALEQPVDIFFTEVMVMVEDLELRTNRLALLGQLYAAFSQIADFSHAYSLTSTP